jgi:hypothetical protein
MLVYPRGSTQVLGQNAAPLMGILRFEEEESNAPMSYLCGPSAVTSLPRTSEPWLAWLEPAAAAVKAERRARMRTSHR